MSALDGVLLMELITDADGNVAPRLNDVALTREQALVDHGKVIRYVVHALRRAHSRGSLGVQRAGGRRGPVIIDLPQVVDAAANNQARAMLERDVDNMRNYYGMYAPSCLKTRYAREMWSLFEDGKAGPRDRAHRPVRREPGGHRSGWRAARDRECPGGEAMARRARLQAEQEESPDGPSFQSKRAPWALFVLDPGSEPGQGWRPETGPLVTRHLAKARMTALPVGGGGANGLPLSTLTKFHQICSGFGQGARRR